MDQRELLLLQRQRHHQCLLLSLWYHYEHAATISKTHSQHMIMASHSRRLSIHYIVLLLGRPPVRRKAKLYPWTSFFFPFYQYTALISRAVDGHSGGSVLGKALTIDIDISPTPPLIFKAGQKCEIWRRFQHHSWITQL